ncbi:MAG: hypothetical protein JWO82_541 [Akkermansiaceae bacterium]|nr:hypothetical protein [Akkermansiaceae bacterium]
MNFPMALSEKVRRLAEQYAELSEEEHHEFLDLIGSSEDPNVSAEWKEEIHSRARDIDEGRVELIDGEEFLARLRERFA